MGSDGVVRGTPQRSGPLLLAVSACFICCALACCGGGGASGLPAGQALAPAGGAAGFDLPAPSALKGASYEPAELICCGAEYVDAVGYPLQSATVDGDCCAFSPNWTAASHPPDGLAYACYAFGMEGYDRAQTITFDWQLAGAAGDLWIGLADFVRDRWVWHQPAGDVLAADFTDCIDPETHTLLVLPLLTGEDDWRLSRIQIGDLATLSGHVWQADGVTPLSDAEVSVDGPATFSTLVDFEGGWSICGVPPGDYSVSAGLVGWDITPASRPVTVDGLEIAVEDFLGTPLPTHTVSGYVLVNPGATPLRGVEMAVSPQAGPGGSTSEWTGFEGEWSMELPDGDYVVVPDKAGWTFSPESCDFSVQGADVMVDEFFAEKLAGFELDGYVFEADGITPLEDVQINVTHDELDLYFYARTDRDGYWYVKEAPNGDYTVVPLLLGWVFEPAEHHPTVADADVRVDPFLGTELGQFTIDGYVYLDDGITPLAGVTLQLSCDTGWFKAQTSSLGHYVFPDIYAGQCTVTPADGRYSFEPDYREFQLVADTTLDPFLGTELPTYNVDGYIYRSDGTTPVEGVLVTVYAYIPAGTTFETYTDAGGHWLTPGVPPNFYTVWPQKQGHTFEPRDRAIEVVDSDLTVDDFISSSLPAYAMDGYVYETVGSNPVPNVLITVESESWHFETATDATGHWQLDEVFEDSYTVTPMLAPWVFDPPTRAAEVSGGDVYVPPFYGEELAAWTVDGYIYEADSTTPVPDIEVWCDNGTTKYRCYSDASGHYQLPLPSDDWTVWPDASCWDFTPLLQNITVDGAPLTLDVFYASPGG